MICIRTIFGLGSLSHVKGRCAWLKDQMTEWTPSFIHKCIISNSCFSLSLSLCVLRMYILNAWHFVNAYLSTFSFTPSPLLLLPLSLSFIRYCGKNRTLESCSRLTQNHKAILWFIDSAVKSSRCVLFFITFVVQKKMDSGKYRDYPVL